MAAALTLGWVMGELFYGPFPQPAPNDTEPPEHLPGLGHLRAYDRYRTRVARAEGMAAQACCDAATQAWADGIKAVEQAQLSQLKSDWGVNIAALHVRLLGAFAGADMALCHAYDLGRSLCKTTRPPKTVQDLEELFAVGRVDTMRARLSELTDLLPPHAASAVSSSLLTWRQWVVAGDHGTPVLDHSRRHLGSQGSLWLAVLTGEKSALSALSAADFVIAAKLVSFSLTKYAGNLAVSYLGPLVLVLLATVGVVAAVFYFPSAPAVIGALGGLAAALGITRKAAQVDGDTVLRRIMARLWAEELDAAAAESLTQLPKSPKKSLGVERETLSSGLSRATAVPPTNEEPPEHEGSEEASPDPVP